MIPRVTLRRALADPNLLGSALPGDSWKLWRILLIASMGEELIEDEREIFTQLTGREREPSQRVDQFVAVVGRRGGKSRAMSVLVAYVAGLCDHTDVLVRGETGVALCVALDQRVAGIVRDHCAAVFEDSPILRQLIANRTQRAYQRHQHRGASRQFPQAERPRLMFALSPTNSRSGTKTAITRIPMSKFLPPFALAC
jgi:hypothetical protein